MAAAREHNHFCKACLQNDVSVFCSWDQCFCAAHAAASNHGQRTASAALGAVRRCQKPWKSQESRLSNARRRRFDGACRRFSRIEAKLGLRNRKNPPKLLKFQQSAEKSIDHLQETLRYCINRGVEEKTTAQIRPFCHKKSPIASILT